MHFAREKPGRKSRRSLQVWPTGGGACVIARANVCVSLRSAGVGWSNAKCYMIVGVGGGVSRSGLFG